MRLEEDEKFKCSFPLALEGLGIVEVNGLKRALTDLFDD